MNNNTQPISVEYSDEKLKILVEEYITQQETDFTFKGVCSYIAYWAMEDGKADKGELELYESNELQQSDQERICRILDAIVADGRIVKMEGDAYRFVKR